MESVALLTSSSLCSSSIETKINDGEIKPRRGSFEITIEREDGKNTLLWTGLKRGPPRRLKFPEPSEMLAEAKNFLKM